MRKLMIITALILLAMTTTVGCGKKTGITTNDLLHRKTTEVPESTATTALFLQEVVRDNYPDNHQDITGIQQDQHYQETTKIRTNKQG